MNKTELIKEMILETKMSMKSFACKADLPYTTLRSILERGIDNASINNVLKICNALNISIDRLYSANNVTSLAYDQRKLLDIYSTLNDCGKKEALKRISELAELNPYKKNSYDSMKNDSSRIQSENESENVNEIKGRHMYCSEPEMQDQYHNNEDDFDHIGMAAHNDLCSDENEQLLMQKDLDEL